MVREHLIVLLIATLLVVSGCNGQPPPIYTESFPHLEPLIYRCFEMNASHASPILGEPISLTQTIDFATDFCIFASDQPNPAPISEEGMLPIYGPLENAEYVATSLGERDKRDDTLTELIMRLLQTNQKGQLQTFDQLSDIGFMDNEVEGFNDLLAQLASVDSHHPNLTRQFIHRTGDDKYWSGSLWLWQKTANGQHVASLFTFSRHNSITIQALVEAKDAEAEVQKQMLMLLEYLIEVEQNAPA